MSLADWLRLLLLSLLWGGSFFFGEVAVEAVPPLTLALLRVCLAAATLLLLALLLGRLAGLAQWPWGKLLVMGFLNNAIPFSLILWGQTEIDSGLASILNATTPFWAVLLATWLVPSEGLTPARFCGLLLGLAGVILLIGPGALAGLGDSLLHQAVVLLAAVSYALAGLWGRRLAGVTPWQAACGQLVCSSLLLLPLAVAVDRPWSLPLPGLEVMAAILCLAVFSTALAYLLFFRLLKDAGSTNLMLVTMLIPPSALLLGSLFLGETLGPLELAGLALVLGGLIAIDGRFYRTVFGRGRKLSTG
ncbi:MAG: DMT family transporter [Rhodospirillales bacterium]